jgi:ring-1,2-phenylacetyl-CoA epoxidase subunit PaaA
LESYTTYSTYFELMENQKAPPGYEVETAKGRRLLMRHVGKHPHTIESKAKIMLDHFFSKTIHKIGGEAKAMIQRAVDWMVPMAVEWFGLPDDMKRHSGQLDYKLKGMTNDELRQTWMKSTVPLCESIGVCAPAHWSEEEQQYVLDYPFPCEYDETDKRWLFDEGEIGWNKVFERWKRRGPANRKFVEMIQEGRGFRQQLEMAA